MTEGTEGNAIRFIARDDCRALAVSKGPMTELFTTSMHLSLPVDISSSSSRGNHVGVTEDLRASSPLYDYKQYIARLPSPSKLQGRLR